MKTIIRTALAVIVGLSLGQVAAQERAVLSIGAQQWSAQGFARLLEASQVSGALVPQQLAAFSQNFAELHVLARQAEASGLAVDARVAERIALARDRILADEARKRLRESAPVDAAAVIAAFEARPHDRDEIRLRHILVRVTADDPSAKPGQRRTAAQALALAASIRKQLQRGGSFAALARKHSEDPTSTPGGGELPVMFAKDLKTEVAPTVLALKPGEVSAPVRSSDGYHLIRLEERTATGFEGSRGLLEFDLREAWVESQIEQLRLAAPVAFDLVGWQAEQARTLTRH